MRKLKKIFLPFFVATLLMSSTLCAFAASDDFEIISDDSGNVLFSGTYANLTNGSALGCFGTGLNVSVSDTKLDDVAALAGYNVSLSSVESDSTVFIAGYNNSVKETTVDGNIIGAGYSINVDEKSSCKASYLAGETIVFNGKAQNCNLAGNSVYFDGEASGSVVLEGDSVTVGSNAKISGMLTIRSEKEPEVSKTAEIADYNWIKLEDKSSSEAIVKVAIGTIILSKVKSALYWAVAAVLMGLIMCWLMDNELKKAATMVKENTGVMLASGAITFVAMPLACIIGCCTYFGAPAASAVTTIYILLMCVAVTFTGASLGREVFKQLPPIVGSLIGIVILEVVKVIPILGGLIFIAATIYTLGFFIQSIYINRIKR